jgi:hypothetical protein
MYLKVKMTDIAEAEPSLLARADVRVPIPGRNTHNFGLVPAISFLEDVRLERQY